MPYFYLIIFFVLMLCAMIEVCGANKRTTIFIRLIAFLLVFSTAAFKYETGIDWRVYKAIFYLQWPIGDIFTIGWTDFIKQFGFEPGYMLFTATIKQLGGTIQTVFFATALINIFLLYKSLNYFSKYPILCLLGYYCFVFFILDMSGIRQSLALNIALFGMRYACQRKLLKYIFCIFIAASFHQTAYFLLIIYPLFYKQKFNCELFLSFYFLSLIIMFLKIKWIQSFSSILLPLIGIEGTFNEKLITYVFSSNYDDVSISIIKVLFGLVIILYVYFYRNIILDSAISRISFLCLIIFSIVNNLMFELSEINTRISAYLIVFVIIVGADIINKSVIYTNRLILSFIIIFYCFLYGSIYILEKPSTLPYYPYQNYAIYTLFDIKSTGEQRLDEFAYK